MRHLLRLIDKEADFLTRSQGKRLRDRLKTQLDDLESGDCLKIDFSGIQVMTPSFADECFGKLAEQLGGTRFREQIVLHGANDTIRILVNSVLADRLHSQT